MSHDNVTYFHDVINVKRHITLQSSCSCPYTLFKVLIAAVFPNEELLNIIKYKYLVYKIKTIY